MSTRPKAVEASKSKPNSDHEWAEKQFASVKSRMEGVGRVLLELKQNWTEGKNLSQFYDGKSFEDVAREKVPTLGKARIYGAISEQERRQRLLDIGTPRKVVEAIPGRAFAYRGVPDVTDEKLKDASVTVYDRDGDIKTKPLVVELGLETKTSKSSASKNTKDAAYWPRVIEALFQQEPAIDDDDLRNLTQTAMRLMQERGLVKVVDGEGTEVKPDAA